MDKTTKFVLLFTLIASCVFIIHGYKKQLAADLAVCEEYGYTLARTKGYIKYCGLKDKNGHLHWQKLSYIKRQERSR